MGLLLLIIFAVYLLVSAFVIRKTVRWAKANGRKPWLWGGLAAFLMYNLVFWDWIPTLIAHKYYCSTQAGFTVFKTPEQWKSENPELTLENLRPLGKDKKMFWDFPYERLRNNPDKKVLMLNKRIYLDTDYEENIWGLRKSISFIADNSNNKKLAQIVNFQSGYGNIATSQNWQAYKFWLSKSDCGISKNGHEWEASGFNDFVRQIIDLGK